MPSRYENGYRTAQLLISTGNVFMYWVSWIYGLYLVLAGPLSSSGAYSRYGGSLSLRILVIQTIPRLYQVVHTWAVGLLLVGIGHILKAVLDTASSSSPPPADN